MNFPASIPGFVRQSAVLTLQQTACLYVIGNLHDFDPRQISLLPVKVRFLLLVNLPVSDVLKLEHTHVTDGVDMQAVWSILTNKTLPTEYTAFVHSPLSKGSLSMKELYLEVLATVIFNNMCNPQSSSGYQSHRDLALDLMFSIRNCLGILNWEQFLANSPGWLQYFQTFPSTYRQDRVIPVRRYHNHYNRSISDVSLVTYYLSECYYFPSRVSVIATPFVQSTFWTDKFYPMVMERMRMFISRAESLWFSAIGEGDRISLRDNITRNFPCALRFIASEILANPMSSFKRVCLQALDVKTLSSLVSAITPLLAYMKSPFAQFCVNSNHAPYRYLKELYVAQPKSGPQNEGLAHSLLFECLGSIITCQEQLEELSLGGIDLLVDCPNYSSLASALLLYVVKPSMAVFYLSDLPILRPLLQDIVERFLQSRTHRNQRLHLNNVRVDPLTIPPNGIKTVVNMIAMRQECINHKQLKLSQMHLPNRIVFWLFHKVHVFHLHTLELHRVTVDPHCSILGMIASHPGLFVQKLCLSEVDIPRCNATIEDFRCLLTRRCLKVLSITRCQLGRRGLLQDLATALNRIQTFTEQSPIHIPFVDVLNLSENDLGQTPDAIFCNFFGALFRLTLQPSLGLDIRDNKMTPHHFTLIYVMWAKFSNGRKLKQLQCQWNHVPIERHFLSQVAQWLFV